MRRTAKLAVLVATLGLLAGFARAVTRPNASLADVCDPNGPFNTAARTFDGVTNHRGDRAYGENGNGIWVPSSGDTTTCVRVSSLIVTANGGDDQVEVGWFDATGVQGFCSYAGSGPRQLWHATVNGKGYCATQTPASISNQDTFHGFEVHDGALDGNWQFIMDGTTFKSESFPMTAGVIGSNGERHGNDSAYSEFKSLQFQDGSGWHDWVSTGAYSAWNNDPDFHNVFFADPTHVKVVRG